MFSFKRVLPICASAVVSCSLVYCAPRTKDPNDCPNPVCADKMDFFNAAKKQFEQDKSKSSAQPKQSVPSSSSAIPVPASTPVTTEKSEKDLEDRDCPMDRAELGRNTWSLLHSMAAFYPDNPQPSHQKHAINFIKALSVLYPCSFCAMEFRESIKQSPPK
jgi:FAD-linked sulfhydryl oxidase